MEIAAFDEGYFLSHSEAVRAFYSGVETENGTNRYQYKSIVFDIRTPYRTDLQALNVAQGRVSKKDKKAAQSKKRTAEVLHSCCQSSLNLKNKVTNSGLFSEPPTLKDIESNNKAARTFVSEFLQKDYDSLITFKGENPLATSKIIQMSGGKFIIPPKSSYYQEDVSKLSDLNRKFDIIVIDPPWQNRFIKRKIVPGDNRKGYNMMENVVLTDMCVDQLIKPNTLVAVWCTNSSSHLQFLKEELLPNWGLCYVSTWYWVKVTQSGEFVTPFKSDHSKQPYEHLIFGRSTTFDQSLPNPKDGKIILSVPSAIHSFKPPLKDIVKEYVKDVNCGLEIFARSLVPHWISWGNQVLLLQNEDLFTENT